MIEFAIHLLKLGKRAANCFVALFKVRISFIYKFRLFNKILQAIPTLSGELQTDN